MSEKNSDRIVDARLIFTRKQKKPEDQELLENFLEIKEFLGITSDVEVVKACIKRSYQEYFSKFIQKEKK